MGLLLPREATKLVGAARDGEERAILQFALDTGASPAIATPAGIECWTLPSIRLSTDAA